MSPDIFATRFKAAREKKNVTIKALQPKVGASSSAMSGYATGKNLPPLDVAAKIARELDVSLDWLCGLREDADDIAQPTVGSIVRMLSFMLTTHTVTTGDNKRVNAAQFVKWSDGSVSIQIDQDNLPSVMEFSSWNSFIDLYQNGTIEAEMYNAWIEKKAKELDKIVLPVVSHTDVFDLPF